ncbi:hypothetical protein BKA01_006962 [Pseudonocardia eucalypti]|nr:hypothetical protein [Pseudonocardia eucalypti]
MTDRDRRVLALLIEHRVATADQIARVEFPCPNRARVRLEQLATRHFLARWRPYVRPGSAPYHYTVGPVGAALDAAANERPAPKPSEVARDAWRLEHSPNLAHRLGVVEFFTRLHGHARTFPGAALVEWWSEETTAPECMGVLRPDGYGRWTEPTRDGQCEVQFLYEHDRGTEPLDTLLAKLDKYRILAERHQVNLPVLIELPTHVREANLHRAIARRRPADGPFVFVATTSTEYLAAAGHNPAGPIWRPAGASAATGSTRYRLATLPTRGDLVTALPGNHGADLVGRA